MSRTTHNGIEYVVKFKHGKATRRRYMTLKEHGPNPSPRQVEVPFETDCTTCTILAGSIDSKDESKQTVTTATVYRFHKDQANLKLARKAAVEKALHGTPGLGREERRVIWNSLLSKKS